MRPNYITEHRNFLKEARAIGLGATPQLMYMHLLDIANDADWPEAMHISNVELGQRLGCSDESILRARRALLKMGRIEYLGQRRMKPLYRIRYYTQAVDNPVDNAGENGGEGRPGGLVEKGVEQPVEQGVERTVEQGVEQSRNPEKNQYFAPGVEQGVEHAVEQDVEEPVERAVERPVEPGVETSQRETPNETPKSSSSSIPQARDPQAQRHWLANQLSAMGYPPGNPVEEALVTAWARDFDPEVLMDMLQLALKRGMRSYRYLEVGLARLQAEGITTLAAYRAREGAFAAKRAGQSEAWTAQRGNARPVKEVAQHRYSGQRRYTQQELDALVTDPFA